MRKLFVVAAVALALFEAANVYLIMPLPGSQRLPSVDLAYFFHTWRWAFRALFATSAVMALPHVWRAGGWRRIAAVFAVASVGAIAYAANFVMPADRLFLQPRVLTMAPAAQNRVDTARLVVGTVVGGEARAYPIQFIGYHHQVRDSIGGRPVMVSYCTVCRTGRVFVPLVDGKLETFRLVGMDQFNAMFEDATTGSWWRQANGEAITGPLKGTTLAELPSWQVSLGQWLALHPASLVMQPDSAFVRAYGTSYDFESGASKSELTGTDTVSWNDKAWVVGLTVNGASRAYDWNRLKRERVVNDTLGGVPVVVALARGDKGFFAFRRPDAASLVAWQGDTLVSGGVAYALDGTPIAASWAGRASATAPAALAPLQASQEFWHSWRTFQPATTKY
jgi:hypothetical protein